MEDFGKGLGSHTPYSASSDRDNLVIMEEPQEQFEIMFWRNDGDYQVEKASFGIDWYEAVDRSRLFRIPGMGKSFSFRDITMDDGLEVGAFIDFFMNPKLRGI